jgi:hypothetical protein
MDEQASDAAGDEGPLEVYVLSISHRHGEDHWGHRTEDGAWKSLDAPRPVVLTGGSCRGETS